ncbi:MAG: hypothetical protein LUF32_01260 [Clostridiales bacterium]|nr:hypothetical protein [Clostridiales bacterium]
MALTYYVKMGRKESADTPKYCRTHGIVPLYREDHVTSDVIESGSSEFNYDLIITEGAKDYVFPDGETEKGYRYIFRWSTNPFAGIVKCKDVAEYPDEFIKGYCAD